MNRRRQLPARRATDPLAAFLRYVEEIESAVVARDAMRITALLRKRTATHLPRDIREELLLISRLSRASLRAPVQFFRFQHRMKQLALGNEPLPTAQTELTFELPATEGTIRRTARQRAAARRARPDRPSAAHEQSSSESTSSADERRDPDPADPANDSFA